MTGSCVSCAKLSNPSMRNLVPPSLGLFSRIKGARAHLTGRDATPPNPAELAHGPKFKGGKIGMTSESKGEGGGRCERPSGAFQLRKAAAIPNWEHRIWTDPGPGFIFPSLRGIKKKANILRPWKK